MSLFDRRRLVMGLCVATLAACNFQPVYGPGGSGEVIRNQIQIAAPATRQEFVLVAHFEERVGTGSRYLMSYDLSTSRENIGIDGADNIDRVNVLGRLDFEVLDTATGSVVQSGAASTFTAYATTASPVATASARRDAEDRLMIALADQVVTQLISQAPTW